MVRNAIQVAGGAYLGRSYWLGADQPPPPPDPAPTATTVSELWGRGLLTNLTQSRGLLRQHPRAGIDHAE